MCVSYTARRQGKGLVLLLLLLPLLLLIVIIMILIIIILILPQLTRQHAGAATNKKTNVCVEK